MGTFKVETYYGNVMVRNAYDCATGKPYYEVYEPNLCEEECGYGKFIGEFISDYDYNNDFERVCFIYDLEDMLNENDYMGNPTTPNCNLQELVVRRLERLMFKRFSVESLEKKLSEIFGGEEIHIELGYLDVEDETAPDWNYMFTSEQDVIGGDFDIYVLMQRNKDINGNTMYVTEIACEFFQRY